MNCRRNEPWTPTNATYALREIGSHPALSLAYKVHATQRLTQRGIVISDVLYLLRKGFVYSEAITATQRGYYKYVIESVTPNSAGRQIAAVVLPNANTMSIKIVTVYWVDEHHRRAGTLMED
jgi:hypothetical protein